MPASGGTDQCYLCTWNMHVNRNSVCMPSMYLCYNLLCNKGEENSGHLWPQSCASVRLIDNCTAHPIGDEVLEHCCDTLCCNNPPPPPPPPSCLYRFILGIWPLYPVLFLMIIELHAGISSEGAHLHTPVIHFGAIHCHSIDCLSWAFSIIIAACRKYYYMRFQLFPCLSVEDVWRQK